ncbi:hypothetical protein CASFOL_036921 [Castilleja foliolosa]|uniref:Uncharacterized protein n=1 Tax=Castilleja foliolosa TaxID=1961234 RepID=A0ABD3BQE3_9LAMI
MQNTGVNGCSVGGRVRAADVISKLKDDGDFDRLRLKIIRKWIPIEISKRMNNDVC